MDGEVGLVDMGDVADGGPGDQEQDRVRRGVRVLNSSDHKDKEEENLGVQVRIRDGRLVAVDSQDLVSYELWN